MTSSTHTCIHYIHLYASIYIMHLHTSVQLCMIRACFENECFIVPAVMALLCLNKLVVYVCVYVCM